MNGIVAWLAAHAFAAGVLTVVALIIGVGLLWGLWVLYVWMRWLFLRADRSGANLVLDGLSVTHDAADEVVFSWTIRNIGKFPARNLYVGIGFSTRQTDRETATWRQSRMVDALAAGTELKLSLRIARPELRRLAKTFDKGTASLRSRYSAASPGRAISHYDASGPSVRHILSVAPLGDADCVTVTDFTPIKR